MPDKQSGKPLLRYRKTWIVLAAIVAAVGVLVVVLIIIFPSLFNPSEPDKAPVTTTKVQPGSLDQLRKEFGPWKLIANQTIPARKRVVMLMQNGTKQVGSRRLKPNQSWHPTVVSEFRDIAPHKGAVKVRTNSGNIYALAIRQPFVLESRPETVFAFSTPDRIVSAPAATFLKK